MNGDYIDPTLSVVVITVLWLAVGYQMVTAWLNNSKDDDRG